MATGAPEASNTFQYYVFERLSNFGIRVDSLKPIGQERLDVVHAGDPIDTPGPSAVSVPSGTVCT